MEISGNLLQGIAALAWPLVLIVLLVLFRNAIQSILESARWRKFTIKVAGHELTMEEASTQQLTLISDLQTQIASMQEVLDSLTQGRASQNVEKVASTPTSVGSILWVDDNPRNNASLIENLERLGVRIVTAVSTADALASLERRKFDAIISDMGRTESGTYNPTAGLDLVRNIRARDPDVPLLIYSSSRAADAYREEALRSGAVEVTSSPTTLMKALKLGKFG